MNAATSDWLFHLGRVMDATRVLSQAAWVRLLQLTGALWFAKRSLRRRGAIVVLTFHRILDTQAFRRTDSLAFIVVQERTFGQLVRYISGHFETVDMRTAVPGEVRDRLRVGFTFDDGWQDNYAVALPILKAHGIPATVFLCTGLTGQQQPFWPERVRGALRRYFRAGCGPRAETLIESLIESLKYCSQEARDAHVRMLCSRIPESEFGESFEGDATLTWDEVRAMDGQGVRFGSHTHSHPILTSIPAESVAGEIRDSKRSCEAMIGRECDLFAYPNGDWSPEVREIVAEHGFRRAFITERGAWLPGSDPLAIPRSNVQQQDLTGLSGRFSPAMFEYVTFWKIWLATRRSEKRGRQAPLPALNVPQESA